jgi:CheY-like chemotaxis protein
VDDACKPIGTLDHKKRVGLVRFLPGFCPLGGSSVVGCPRVGSANAESLAFDAISRGTIPERERVSSGDDYTMLTNALHVLAPVTTERCAPVTAQKVVIVNGSAEVLELVESVLEAGHYDIVFVESNAHAYSQIKRVRPNLVILCIRIDDADAFQVLSMLKLDQETRDIPLLTYTTEREVGGEPDGDEDEDGEESAETGMFVIKPALRMN